MEDLVNINYNCACGNLTPCEAVRQTSNAIYRELQQMSEDDFAGIFRNVAVNVENETYEICIEIKLFN